jgi:glycosyltransferase involved in cell wall biosynthesis
MHLGLDLLFLIPDESGGRETYARELIAAILEREPALQATAFVNAEAGEALQRELGGAMRVVGVPVSARRPAQWAVGELGLLPLIGARAGIDVLHSLANFAPVGGPFRRVITLHDLQYKAVPELLSPARRAGTAALIGLAARRADRLITVSQFARDEIVAELGVAAEAIDVIPNGVAIADEASTVPEAELRARHRLDERPVVLAVATHLPHKNLGTLLAAHAVIADGRRPVLVLVGAGTDGPALQARALVEGASPDVRLLGYRPAPELAGLYQLAAGAVVPSLYEGFGLPVLEAMARGIPVACSDIGALRELAGDAALRFSPFNTSAIAAAIVALVEDRDLGDRLASAGRERAARFSWKAAAEATLSCYRRALAPAGADGR